MKRRTFIEKSIGVGATGVSMADTLVSVVMPAYKAADTVARAARPS